MNLYRITGTGAPIWAASQSEAAAARKIMVSERGTKRADLNTTAVDVPTKKVELVAFLNALENGVVGSPPNE